MKRNLLWLVIFFALLSSCVKHQTPPGDTGGSEEPIQETITTRFAGYATRLDNVPFENVLLQVNQLTGNPSVDMINGAFASESYTANRYATRLFLNDPGDVEPNKTLPLTPAELNYIRIKPMQMNSAGILHNRDGGEFAFANNGSLTIPVNAIYQQAHGRDYGFYGENIYAPISIGYADPLSPDFAVGIPCYAMAEEGNTRWFLNSICVLRITSGYLWMPEDEGMYDFYPTNNGHGVLKIPIPAVTMPLPDTVSLWRLINGRWEKSVTAKKEGGFYTATIRKMGAYNLAVPVKGVYRTVRLRTNVGTPLINATVRIKDGKMVLAEAQTDWEGNAFVFLPVDKTLTVEILGVSRSVHAPIHTSTINTTGTTEHFDINISSSLPTIYALKGTATTCDGNEVTKGEIILHSRGSATVDWHIPVTNGVFNAGIVDVSGGSIYYATLTDNLAGITGADTVIVIDQGATTTCTFSTCPPRTDLYMNYTIDGGVTTSISGDMSNAYDPYLIASQYTGKTTVAGADSSNHGVQFDTYGVGPGTYTGSGIYTLFVNEQLCFWDLAKPMRVTFDRYDILAGGIVSGSSDFWYRDQNSVQHHLQTSFRLKRGF